MPARSSTRAVATAPVNNRGKRNRRATTKVRRKVYGELVELYSKNGAARPAGISTADMLQECLERAVGGMRYAASEVDKLAPDAFWVHKTDAQGNILVEPNKWYQLELTCREEVERLAGMMASLGIAERAVRVEEAKAALVVAKVRDAARRAGLSSTQVRALGAALREGLEAEDAEQVVAA